MLAEKSDSVLTQVFVLPCASSYHLYPLFPAVLLKPHSHTVIVVRYQQKCEDVLSDALAVSRG